jgi:hypothetical protein
LGQPKSQQNVLFFNNNYAEVAGIWVSEPIPAVSNTLIFLPSLKLAMMA